MHTSQHLLRDTFFSTFVADLFIRSKQPVILLVYTKFLTQNYIRFYIKYPTLAFSIKNDAHPNGDTFCTFVSAGSYISLIAR